MIVAHAARVRTLARDPRAPRMKADMMRRSRAKRLESRTTNHGLAAEVQSLEARSLPTGTVTASLSNGNLTIGGDNLDNTILIEVRTSGIFLTGLPDQGQKPIITTIKFGAITKTEGEAVQLTSTSTPTTIQSLKSLTILMRGGKDVVRMDVGVAESEPEPDAPILSITGRVRVNLGAGDDHGALLLNNGTLTIGGNLEGDLEGGNDCFLVMGGDPQVPIKVDGSVIILGRLGDDVIGLADIDVKKSVTINGSFGNDSISLQSTTVKGSVSLDGYDGEDGIQVEDTTITGTTTIRGGSGKDGLRINNLDAKGNVSVNMGSGDDLISVGTLILGDATKVTLDGSSGTDALVSESELTDPSIKRIRIESSTASQASQDIIDLIATRILDCLDVITLTPPE